MSRMIRLPSPFDQSDFLHTIKGNSSSASFESTDIQRFTTIQRGFYFFTFFANAMAFFRKHQRLKNDIQKCFSSFFRSEADFDFLFISDGVPLLL